MKPNNSYDVVIIGAGPSGLSLAYYLNQNNIRYIILEKKSIGNSWENMPKNWRVVSPQWTNILPGSHVSLMSLYSKPNVSEYCNYLKSYAKRNELIVRENCNVLDANYNDKNFNLITNKVAIECKLLVSATGYFSNPFIPFNKDNDNSICSIHVNEYRSPDSLLHIKPDCNKVLIIGRKVSAGQLMVELHEHGFNVSISANGKVIPRNGSLFGRIKDAIYFPYEAIRIKLQPNISANSYPNMDGGKSEDLLGRGIVTVYSEIMSIRNGMVNFKDGRTEAFDLIVYATGYKPELEYLNEIIRVDKLTGLPRTRNMQSLDNPNLFFIGLDQLMNFRSRYLRGIRKDSKILADIIADKFNLNNNQG